MTVKIIDFDLAYLKEAAELLKRTQNEQFQIMGIKYKASFSLCKKKIMEELQCEVSSSYILMFEDRLVGYAIATIKRDSIFGDSGWVNLGGWCIDKDWIY